LRQSTLDGCHVRRGHLYGRSNRIEIVESAFVTMF
jgi:hypothetical protein